MDKASATCAVRVQTVKGQYQFMDLTLGITVFVVLLTIMIIMYADTRTRMEMADIYWRMMETNRNIGNALMLTGGEPVAWHLVGTPNQTNIQSIGLADEPNTLNLDKVGTLPTWNASYYNLTRAHLGCGFDMYLEVRYASNGSIYVANGQNATFGIAPNSTVMAANSQRMGWLNGSRVIVNLTVWKEYGTG